MTADEVGVAILLETVGTSSDELVDTEPVDVVLTADNDIPLLEVIITGIEVLVTGVCCTAADELSMEDSAVGSVEVIWLSSEGTMVGGMLAELLLVMLGIRLLAKTTDEVAVFSIESFPIVVVTTRLLISDTVEVLVIDKVTE